MMNKKAEQLKIKESALKLFCIFLGVSLALQDVRFLGELFGPSAASFSGIVMLSALIVSRKDKCTGTLNLYIRELILVTALTSLILLTTQETFLFGETVWVKGLKVALSMALLLTSLKYGQIFYILYKRLLAYIAFPYLVTIYLGVLLERIGLFPTIGKSFLHYTVNYTERPRGFATEPSTLGYSIIVAICILALVNIKNSSWRRMLLFSIFISGYVVTTSRGYIGSVALTVPFVLLLVLLKRIEWLNAKLTATLITTFLLAQSVFIGLLLRSSLRTNFSRGTSDATREVWAQISLSGLSNTPFGAGYQGLITAAPLYLKDYVQSNISRFSNSSLREMVFIYSQSGDFALSPKTITSLFVLTSGVFGVAFLFNIIYKTMYFSIQNKQVKFWELLGIFLLIVSLLSYAGSLTSFAGFFLLGVCLERFKFSEKDTNVD